MSMLLLVIAIFYSPMLASSYTVQSDSRCSGTSLGSYSSEDQAQAACDADSNCMGYMHWPCNQPMMNNWALCAVDAEVGALTNSCVSVKSSSTQPQGEWKVTTNTNCYPWDTFGDLYNDAETAKTACLGDSSCGAITSTTCESNFKMCKTGFSVTADHEASYCIIEWESFGTPTEQPIGTPTEEPTTMEPTLLPTEKPTTKEPTLNPTEEPTTKEPTLNPTEKPTTEEPTAFPTKNPTGTPTTEAENFKLIDDVICSTSGFGTYTAESEAKAACMSDSSCGGYFSWPCGQGTYFLCDVDYTSKPMPSACLKEKPIFPTSNPTPVPTTKTPTSEPTAKPTPAPTSSTLAPTEQPVDCTYTIETSTSTTNTAGHANGSACCSPDSSTINTTPTDQDGCADRCTAEPECEGFTLHVESGMCYLITWNGGTQATVPQSDRVAGSNKQCVPTVPTTEGWTATLGSICDNDHQYGSMMNKADAEAACESDSNCAAITTIDCYTSSSTELFMMCKIGFEYSSSFDSTCVIARDDMPTSEPTKTPTLFPTPITYEEIGGGWCGSSLGTKLCRYVKGSSYDMNPFSDAQCQDWCSEYENCMGWGNKKSKQGGCLIFFLSDAQELVDYPKILPDTKTCAKNGWGCPKNARAQDHSKCINQGGFIDTSDGKFPQFDLKCYRKVGDKYKATTRRLLRQERKSDLMKDENE